jgi:O-acetyl-ADP-ribose deacetylase (regulator of RNase III)
MRPPTYLQGDATAPQAAGNKVIAHVCNDVGRWGKGFVMALSARWAAPEEAFSAWYAGRAANDFGLGAVQLVPVEPDLWVANLVGQHGLTAKDGVPPIRYEAIEQGLGRLAGEALRLGASVHMPRIGCGLAGGRWELIEPILLRTLCDKDIAVTVYDR